MTGHVLSLRDWGTSVCVIEVCDSKYEFLVNEHRVVNVYFHANKFRVSERV